MNETSRTAEMFSLLFKLKHIELVQHKCGVLNKGELAMLTALNAYNGNKSESLTITELQNRLKTTQPAVTQLVNRLERRGFAKRTENIRDRRTILVETTPKGLALFEEEYQAAMEEMDSIVERLGEEKSDMLISLLNELTDFDTQYYIDRGRK